MFLFCSHLSSRRSVPQSRGPETYAPAPVMLFEVKRQGKQGARTIRKFARRDSLGSNHYRSRRWGRCRLQFEKS